MILPDRQYGFNAYKKNKKSRIKRIFIIIIFLLAISAAVIIIAFFLPKKDNAPKLSELFSSQEYEQINEFAEKTLSSKPLDYNALVYNGLAYHYRGYSEYAAEKRFPLFQHSIKYLRKAELMGSAHAGEVEYVLGKSYYYLGSYYYDLAEKYLLKSLKNGYVGNELYETLGLVYANLGFYDQSLEYLNKALDLKSSDLLYNTIARVFHLKGDLDQAANFYIRTISKTEDKNLELKTIFQLGLVYFDQNKLELAKEQFEKLIGEDDNNADAYFYLGNIYEAKNDNVMARAEWRKAYNIDPKHLGARQKLYGN